MVDSGPTRRKPAPKPKPKADQAAADLQRFFTSGEFQPGALLPSEAELMQRFGLTRWTVREALEELRRRGAIVTDKGKGSTLREARAGHTLTRDADDPTRHLRPIKPAQPSRDRASAVTAELFDIRDRAPLYITEQLTEHRTTGARVFTIRTIPVEVLFPFEPEPDAFGDRTELIKALSEQYGPLAFYERTRFLLKPPPEVRTDLDLDPTTPVAEIRRLTRAATGRLLIVETEYAEATSAEWQYKL